MSRCSTLSDSPVTDPSQASRTITSYYDKDGKLVKRVLGKAMIMRSKDENELDGT